jgi:hypothetical protein
MSTRGPTEAFKARFQYVLSVFRKEQLEIGGVRVDADNNSFTFFTPEGAAVHDKDDFEAWKEKSGA